MSKKVWNKGLPKEQQPFYGKRHTDKHKIKMSKLKNNLGKKQTPAWKENISKSLLGNTRAKGKYWSPRTLIRKNQVVCQCNSSCVWHRNKQCGFPHKEALELDHIKPKSKYPELVNELSNMQMLCSNCHKIKSNREKNEHKQLSKAVQTPV